MKIPERYTVTISINLPENDDLELEDRAVAAIALKSASRKSLMENSLIRQAIEAFEEVVIFSADENGKPSFPQYVTQAEIDKAHGRTGGSKSR